MQFTAEILLDIPNADNLKHASSIVQSIIDKAKANKKQAIKVSYIDISPVTHICECEFENNVGQSEGAYSPTHSIWADLRDKQESRVKKGLTYSLESWMDYALENYEAGKDIEDLYFDWQKHIA